MPLTEAEQNELRELEEREELAELRKWEKQSLIYQVPQRKAAKEWYDAQSGPQQWATSFVRPFGELRYGVGELLGEERTLEEEKDLYRLRAADKFIPRMAGEVAMFAAPGAGAVKLAQATTKGLPKALAAAAPVAADVLASGGVEALKAPDYDQTRLGNFQTGLVGGGLGLGLSKTIGAMGKRGIARTDLADRQLAEGVQLTPGQMSSGSLVPWLERRFGDVPGVAGKIRKQQKGALESWNKNILQRVAPPPIRKLGRIEISDAGATGFKELGDAYKNSYDTIWSSAKVGDQAVPIVSQGRRMASNLPSTEANRAVKNLDWVEHNLRKAAEGDNSAVRLDAVDNFLRKAGRSAGNNNFPIEAQLYDTIRQGVRKNLGEGIDADLRAIDRSYAEFKVVERAASGGKATKAKGIFTPDELMMAVRGEGGRRSVARSEAFLQDQAKEGIETINGFVPTQGGGLGEKLTIPAVGAAAILDPVSTAGVIGTGRAFASEPFRRFATGELYDPGRQYADMLRRFQVTSPRVGTALNVVTEDEPQPPRIPIPGQY